MEKEVEASLKRQQRLAELYYQATNYCPHCGGLPAGLPTQVYNDMTECECTETE